MTKLLENKIDQSARDKSLEILKLYSAYNPNSDTIIRINNSKFEVTSNNPNKKSKIYDDIELKRVHEAKTKLTENNNRKLLDDIKYYSEISTGKKFNPESLHIVSRPNSEPILVVNELKITASQYLKEIKSRKPRARTCIRNLTQITNSKLQASIEYYNHELRVGRATKQFFDERTSMLRDRAELINQYDKQAKLTGSKLISLKKGIMELSTPSKIATSYLGAVIKSATSIALIDGNPIFLALEKIVGKAWTTKIANNTSARDLAQKIEERLIEDYITKDAVSSGPISENMIRQAGLEGAAWGFRMSFIPQLLSQIGGLVNFNVSPKAIYDLIRSSKMLAPNLGAIEKLAVIEDRNASRKSKLSSISNYLTPSYIRENIEIIRADKSWKTKIAGAFALVVIPVLEKIVPASTPINPILLLDTMLMKFVGKTLQHSQETGRVLTTSGNILRSVEAALTTSFAIDAGLRLGETFESYKETGKLNFIEDIKTEEELLKLIETNPKIFSDQDTGLFGRLLTIEEELISDLLSNSEDTNTNSTINHLTIEESIYTVESTDQGQIILIKQNSTDTFIYENGVFKNITEASEAVTDTSSTNKEDSNITIKEHRTKDDNALITTTPDQDVENSTSNLENIPTLNSDSLISVIEKYADVDKITLGIYNLTNPDNDIIYNPSREYYDPIIPRLNLVLLALQIDENIDYNLISNVLTDSDKNSYSNLINILEQSGDPRAANLRNTAYITPDNPNFGRVTLNDSLDTIKLLMGSRTSTSDRNFIIEKLQNDTFHEDLSSNSIISIGNISLISNQNSQNTTVIINPNSESPILNNLPIQIYAELNPKQYNDYQYNRLIPNFNISNIDRLEADLHSKILEDNPDITQLDPIEILHNGTSITHGEHTQYGDIIITSDSNGKILTILPIGHISNNLDINDYSSYINANYPPKDVGIYNNQSSILIEKTFIPTTHTENDNYITQSIEIQNSADIPYDYLIFSNSDGAVTIAHVRPHDSNTAQNSEIIIGIVPNENSKLNYNSLEQSLTSLTDILNNSGNLSITNVKTHSVDLNTITQNLNSRITFDNSIIFNQNTAELDINSSINITNLSENAEYALKNAYERAVSFTTAYNSLLGNNEKVIPYEVFLQQLQADPSKYTELDLAKIMGLQPRILEGVLYEHLVYIPDGTTPNINNIANIYNLNPSQIRLQPVPGDPTQYLLGVVKLGVESQPSYEFPINKIVYQIQTTNPNGDSTYKLTTNPSDNSIIVSYIPVENEIPQEELYYWKESYIEKRYLGDAVATLTDNVDADLSKIFVDPITLNSYAVVKHEDKEKLIPVTNAHLTYADLQQIRSMEAIEGDTLSSLDVDKIIEDQIANQIINWSTNNQHFYKRPDSTIVSLTTFHDRNQSEDYRVAKDSNDQMLLTETGQLVFESIQSDKFVYFDKAQGNFIELGDEKYISIKNYLAEYASLTGENNIPLQWNGLPIFTKNEIMYVLSSEGVVSVGSIYQNNELNTTQDLSLLGYLDNININDFQQIRESLSYANLSTDNQRYSHSAILTLPNNFVETSNGVIDLDNNSVFQPYFSGNYVEKEFGQVVFTNQDQMFYIATANGFQLIDESNLTTKSEWIITQGLVELELQDRQTRFKVLIDNEGFASIITSNGIQSLGNYNSLIRLGLIGYERPSDKSFHTNSPAQFTDLVIDNRFSIDEKLGKLLDPTFALITRNVLEKIYNFDNSNLDTSYLKQLFAKDAYIKFDEIPPRYLQAILSSEDELLLSHDSGEGFGVDTRGILRAIVSQILNETTIGGSTIPMQVVRNSIWSVEDRTTVSIDRKISEWILANKLVENYTPEMLLERYLNLINYGVGEGAVYSSAAIFDKNLQELTLAESAMLAVIPKNPNAQGFWSETTANLWADNSSAVLRRMEENGFIDQSERIIAQSEVYQRTHIDTKESDLNLIITKLNLNSDEQILLNKLAIEYSSLAFADRFIKETTSQEIIIPNGISPEGILLPSSNINMTNDTYTYQDFISYLESKDFVNTTTGESVRSEFYAKLVSDMHAPTFTPTYMQNIVQPGPQHQVEYIDPNGHLISSNYWEYKNSNTISILPDITTITSQVKSKDGTPIIFEAIRNDNVGSDFTPIHNSDGLPLVKDNNGNIWAVGQDGLIKQSHHLAFIEHSAENVEVFDANTRPDFLLLAPTIQVERQNIVKDIADRYYEKLPNGDLRIIGDAVQLADGSLYVVDRSQLPEISEVSLRYNDTLLVTLKNTLHSINIEKSISEIYESFSKDQRNPYNGYVGEIDNINGTAANPKVASDALKNLDIDSTPYELLNNIKSIEVFKELLINSKITDKPLIAWINTSLESKINDVTTGSDTSLLIEANNLEKQVIIQDITTINGVDYVLYIDPATSKIKASELDIFRTYLAPTSISPIKLLLVGEDSTPVLVPNELEFKFDSAEVQVALQLEKSEYIYGTNKNIDLQMSINPNLQQAVLESAKDIVINSGSNGFQAIFMDQNGNILSAAGLDKAGNVLPIQTVLNSSFIAGSVMKPITAQILVTQGLDPDKTYSVSTPFHQQLNFTLPSALRVSNTEVFYLPTANLTEGQFEKGLLELGFGKPIDTPFVPNGSGFVGTNEWAIKNLGRELTSEEIARKAIGYGDLEVTLLQLIHAYYGLANNGSNITPSLTSQQQPNLNQPLFTDTNGLDQIIQGLHEVTTNPRGTAYGSFGQIGNYGVYGKTGTAITDGEPNSLFSGYYIDPTTNNRIYFAVIFPQSGSGHIVAAPFVSKIISKCQADNQLCVANNGEFQDTNIDLASQYSPPGWSQEGSNQKELIELTNLINDTVSQYRENISNENPINATTFIDQLSQSIMQSKYGDIISSNPEYLWILGNIMVAIENDKVNRDSFGIPNVLYLRLLSLSKLSGAPAKLNDARKPDEVFNDLNWFFEEGGTNKFNAALLKTTINDELLPGDTIWSKSKELGYGALILDKYTVGNETYYYITNSDTNVWAYDTKQDGRVRDRWVTYNELLFQFKAIDDSLFVIRPNK